jgi:hypothetical protein
VPGDSSGAGAPDYVIKKTHHQPVDSIWQDAEECFADWRVSGPRPPETVVFHLVGEELARVSP